MIGTTARVGNPSLIIAPVRESREFVSCSLIIGTAEQLKEICLFADGKADYIFIDAEGKTPDAACFVTLARSIVLRSTVRTYKGNDITALACDLLISSIIPDVSSLKAAVLGAGNLGSKAALALAERGARVSICRRDDKATLLAEALNSMLSKHSQGRIIAASSLAEAADGAHIVIGFTQGLPVITAEMMGSLPAGALIIDGGIGTLYEEAVQEANQRGHFVYRLDVRIAFAHIVNSILSTEQFLAHTAGRVCRDGSFYVAGGVIGMKGDIVVDSLQALHSVIGVADGKGGVDRSRHPY
ncbi:NAD(P)-binding domain-containing protein [Paenibacillus sp. PL2-23]|uniref:NAD(P)-binding domain-containing protein n=1 Tax=Paenibacillus sp. PL2-23 TaxID=2100729 RepID=UPI0030F757D7